MKTQRRPILKRLFASIANLSGIGISTTSLSAPTTTPNQAESIDVVTHQDVPLYSSATKMGNLLFIFGIGAHFEGDIKAHTDHVLKEMEKELTKAGSSMQKVLKVSVFLHDLDDYKGMNEVFKGRFGPKPPVRTTVAPRAGIPGDSLVEMDCIAYL
ncbi:RidA family protein [Spirosoma sp. BT702]|uniref:RidA family protein n=1 Tax=Spirosoma profusum TaxID=2771354 RepID=A0A926XXG1_9BACT|nr:RidA family protein [Spirosoma profusum]MBD2699558.1 RidA family protein [Spirosoma profusum]